jgi:hypothetical protein
MYTLIIFIYFVITICTIFYTYLITNKKKDTEYIEEVHAHMASIMFFHLSIVALVVFVKPSFLNNIYISILNTLLSVMFSTLFYFTDKDNKKLLYFYNTMYLLFASILMSEIILYFQNDTFVYSFALVFVMFICDIFFYKKDRKNKLLVGYIVLSVLGLSLGTLDFNYIYSVITVALYGLVVLGYMYYDHDYLKEKVTKYHLDDALKYFLDFEGTIVRTIDDYLDKQN